MHDALYRYSTLHMSQCRTILKFITKCCTIHEPWHKVDNFSVGRGRDLFLCLGPVLLRQLLATRFLHDNGDALLKSVQDMMAWVCVPLF
jgi:hypothetical protein